MTNGTVRVAAPNAIGRMPVASGSSVPPCPALRASNRRRARATAAVLPIPQGQQTLRTREIGLGGDLEIVLVALDHGDRHPPPLGQLRVVGEVRQRRVGGGRPMRGQDVREAESLRRLRPPDAGPVDRRLHHPVARALERVRDRHAGECGAMVVQRRQHRRDGGGRHERPHPVMDQHAVGSGRRQALEPSPHRILPRLAAQHGRPEPEPGHRRLVESRIVRIDHHAQLRNLRVPEERQHRAAQHGHAAQRAVLLRHGAAEATAAAGRDDDAG